jgi:hypothetical protein
MHAINSPAVLTFRNARLRRLRSISGVAQNALHYRGAQQNVLAHTQDCIASPRALRR